MRLQETDHAAVSAAVAAAEAQTSGEIVPVAAAASDSYGDVALLWAIAAAFLALALVAAAPDTWVALLDRFRGGWGEGHNARELLTILFVLVVLTFAGIRAILAWTPLRLALTPASVKARRVRARAVALFRAAAEHRTVGATGVLLYLSLAEHRAEIVTDAGIHVAPEAWGEAMAELVDAVRDDRPGEGMAAAIRRIGAALAEHFPPAADDRNELPDRLIEL